MTEKHGWGVMCSKKIPVGTFIAEYTGRVMTSREMNKLKAVRDGVCNYRYEKCVRPEPSLFAH